MMTAQDKDAPKYAEEAFGKPPANDKMLLTVEGGPLLRVRFGMKAPVIKFLVKVGEAQAGK